MNQYLMGIDLGTSGCKIAVFDKLGHVIASATGGYPVYYPKPGYVEQDPDEWWKVISQTVKRCISLADILPMEIVGIGVDGQSWSAIPIDEEGKVLAHTPIWMDTRADDICHTLKEEIGAEKIFECAGNTLQPSYTTAKILWYRKFCPDIYAKTKKILQSNSFIVYRLTDVISQDKSQAYGLHCFNMKRGEWDEKMCEAMGISIDLLPNLYECSEVVGYVTEKAAQACGLIQGIPVVAGGLDAACGALGVGAIHLGDTQEQGGQAGGMSICCEQYCADPALILSYHVVPGKWLLQGGTVGGGGVMRWLEKELGDYERQEARHTNSSSFDLLVHLAEQVKEGSDGLIFLPYMLGERSPIWDPKAKGVYYGLDFTKTKGHLIRAAMEGVAYALKHNLDVAQKAGAQINELRAMGGSANSYLWTQIKSDITGKEIVVPSSDTATTLGAAILAGVGVGIYKDFEEAIELTIKIKRSHKPDLQNQNIYEAGYKKYLALYSNLKDMMREGE